MENCWGRHLCDEIEVQHWLDHHHTPMCDSLAWALSHHGELKFKHLCECIDSWGTESFEDDPIDCYFDLFPIDVQLSGCGDYKYNRSAHIRFYFIFLLLLFCGMDFLELSVTVVNLSSRGAISILSEFYALNSPHHKNS